MRPDAQLFLHVLGATTLFGGVAAVAILALAGRRRPEHGGALAAACLIATLAAAVPGWALTVVFGSWAKSREHLPGTVEWLRIGNGIATAGILVLLSLSGFAYAWIRRPAGRRAPLVLALVSLGYLAALGVAWWVMTAKVPA